MKTDSNSFISLLLNYENIKSKDGINIILYLIIVFYYNCFLSIYLLYIHLSLHTCNILLLFFIIYICISCALFQPSYKLK